MTSREAIEQTVEKLEVVLATLETFLALNDEPEKPKNPPTSIVTGKH